MEQHNDPLVYCRECAWWQQSVNSPYRGDCRRYPPDGEEHITYHNNYCGEAKDIRMFSMWQDVLIERYKALGKEWMREK